MEYVFIVAFMLYLAPWVAAEAIEHRHATTIGFVNVGLGWTGVGWFAAAAWVAREWPREPAPPPELTLVASAARATPIEAPAPPRLPRLALAGLVAATLAASVYGVDVVSTDSAEPEWKHAKVIEPAVPLRLGPGDRWTVVGALAQDCPVRVLAREGAWRRVWRLGGCDAEATASSGWVRVESLIERPAAE